MTPQKTKVGIAGLGRMGSALAARLIDRGYAVAAWNRGMGPREVLMRHGAVVVDRPGDLWSRADVVLSFLADDAAVESVCLGEDGLLVPGGRVGRVLIEMSTISPGASTRLDIAAATAEVAYLRAPVTGNPQVLSAGRLGLIISGPRTLFERCQGLLRNVGPNLFYVGDREQARVLKLAINAMIAGTTQLLAEALVLCEANGMSRADVLEVMCGSAAGSPFVQYKSPALIARDYTPTFSTRLLAKDLALAKDTARQVDVTMPVAEVVLQAALDACEEGFGELDMISLLPHLQRATGRSPDVSPSGD